MAFVAKLMFLAMNDYPIDYHEGELEQLVFTVAKWKGSKEEIARFLKKGLG